MAFVVDDLAAWLVGLLADAGRKKLADLILGDAQERALRQAAIVAVQDTADELSPSDGQRAGQIAMVINEVFRLPVPDAPLAAVDTLVEGLQAGIARQLDVLDDAGLTGTGQSAAEVLGVPGNVLADRMTAYLVREIVLRGSRGGPLTPLADQLNHDLIHLHVRRVEAQGRRIESMLARLAREIQATPTQPGSGAAAPGWPLDEVIDPFALEVHRPVQPKHPQPGLSVLPEYVQREHDAELSSVVRAAAMGSSGIAVLVGGSSTGKTRACWEALQLLRDRPDKWRLWHPLAPSRSDAALSELPTVGPWTVVWLNEAQFYLDVADKGQGEQVAAGLRELLRDPARAPLLVLATLWPEYWDALTIRPVSRADPHAQARELLAGHDICVPTAFTAAQLQRLRGTGDIRLADAAEGAQNGQVIQFLAGVPELLGRYHNAPPAAAALIDVAMDARRLGMGVGLPQAFLEAAALGYLTDAEWDTLDEDWLEDALAYTAVPCKGVRGPLTRIRPRQVRSGAIGAGSRDSGDQLAYRQPSSSGVPLYQLADYLDQHGRLRRKGQFPPAAFWTAATRYAFPADQAALGDAAHARGLYRDAAQLFKSAAADGNLHAIYYLSSSPRYLRPDVRPMCWAAAHVPFENAYAVADTLKRLQEAGAEEPVTTLLRRDPAAHVSLDYPFAVGQILYGLRCAGAAEQVMALADRAATDLPFDNPDHLDWLLGNLRYAGAATQVTALAERAAASVSIYDPGTVARILYGLRESGAAEQITTLLRRNPAAHVHLDDPFAVALLLKRLQEMGAAEQITMLLRRNPAANVLVHDMESVDALLEALNSVSAAEQVTTLADRAATHLPLDNLDGVAWLLDSLQEVGAVEQVTTLADRAATHAPLHDPDGVDSLLHRLRRAGAEEQITKLLRRDPAANVSLDDPYAVGKMLKSLRRAGGEGQVSALLNHDPAANVSLYNLDAVAWLLDSMREAGAEEEVATLLRRDPAAYIFLDNPDSSVRKPEIPPDMVEVGPAAALATSAAAYYPNDSPFGVAWLLASLLRAGAGEQVTTLADRLPGVGMFELFLRHGINTDAFRVTR